MPPISKAKVEIMRQDYLAGTTLRALVKKHKVAMRTITKYSTEGGWEKQRRLLQTSAELPNVAAAADNRAVAVADRWRSQIDSTIGACMWICQRLTDKLQRGDLEVTAPEASTMIQRLISAVERLAAIQAGNAGGGGQKVIFNFNLGPAAPQIIDVPPYPPIAPDAEDA